MHCCHPILWLGDALLVTAQAMGTCSPFPEHSIHSGTAGRVQITPIPAECLSRGFFISNVSSNDITVFSDTTPHSKARPAMLKYKQICRAETTEDEILHWSCRKAQCKCPCHSSSNRKNSNLFGSSNRKKFTYTKTMDICYLFLCFTKMQ